TRTTVQGIEASHELAAGRSTHGGDVEVGKANALAVELIEVRRLQHRIAVAGQIAIALVIGEKNDDVGSLALFWLRGHDGTGERQHKTNDRQDQDEISHGIGPMSRLSAGHL